MYSDSELDFELDLQNCNNKNPNSVPNIQKHQKRIVTNLIRKGGGAGRGGNGEKDLRGGKNKPCRLHKGQKCMNWGRSGGNL